MAVLSTGTAHSAGRCHPGRTILLRRLGRFGFNFQRRSLGRRLRGQGSFDFGFDGLDGLDLLLELLADDGQTAQRLRRSFRDILFDWRQRRRFFNWFRLFGWTRLFQNFFLFLFQKLLVLRTDLLQLLHFLPVDLTLRTSFRRRLASSTSRYAVGTVDFRTHCTVDVFPSAVDG